MNGIWLLYFLFSSTKGLIYFFGSHNLQASHAKFISISEIKKKDEHLQFIISQTDPCHHKWGIKANLNHIYKDTQLLQFIMYILNTSFPENTGEIHTAKRQLTRWHYCFHNLEVHHCWFLSLHQKANFLRAKSEEERNARLSLSSWPRDQSHAPCIRTVES